MKIVRHFLRKHARRVVAKLEEQGEQIIEVDEMPNFFGQKSLGKTQVRGNGVLILTTRLLYFEMWKPNKTYKFYVDTITNLENPKWFLGKNMNRNLLKIDFINENGLPDEAAWLVSDLENWNQLIQDVINKQKNKDRKF